MSKTICDTHERERSTFDISNGAWASILRIIDESPDKPAGFDVRLWQFNGGDGLDDNEGVQAIIKILEAHIKSPVKPDDSVSKMAGYFVDWLRECEGGFEVC